MCALYIFIFIRIFLGCITPDISGKCLNAYLAIITVLEFLRAQMRVCPGYYMQTSADI